MKLFVDKEICIGCGACVSQCPEVFEMDDDGKAYVKTDADYSNCNADKVIGICPVEAISKADL